MKDYVIKVSRQQYPKTKQIVSGSRISENKYKPHENKEPH